MATQFYNNLLFGSCAKLGNLKNYQPTQSTDYFPISKIMANLILCQGSH